jgi:hypothetical protein
LAPALVSNGGLCRHAHADKSLTAAISTATAGLRQSPHRSGRTGLPASTGDTFMRHSFTIAAAAFAVIALSSIGARAESHGGACTTAASDQYLSAADLQAKVEAQGYKVSRLKITKACGEVYAFDKTGAKIELYVDPTNGTIVRSETD